MKTQCSPGAWKTLGYSQRKVWNALYKQMLVPQYFHSDWAGPKFKKQRAVTAHNMACSAVWQMEPIFRMIDFKLTPKKRK